MKQRIIFAAWVLSLFGALAGPVSAQEAIRNTIDESVLNKGRVGIITGGIEYVHDTYARLAAEMAAVLDKEGEIRVLPILGRGPVDNIKDLLYLQGIDVGVVHSDALTFLKNQGVLPAAQRKLRYLAKLYDEYFHVVVRKDIESIEDLAGKKVVVGTTSSSGAAVSALTAFDILGIEPRLLVDDWKVAIEKIKAGEIAGMVYSTVRGSGFIKEIQSDGKLKLLSLPYSDELRETYLRASFTAEDYPNLIEAGTTVETLQFGAIMAVYDWNPGSERYKNVARFITRLFDNLEELRKPRRHARWKTFDPKAEVRGWERFRPAQAWIDAREKELRKIALEEQLKKVKAERLAREQDAILDAQFAEFVEYMRAQGDRQYASEEELAALFEQFMAWRSNQTQ